MSSSQHTMKTILKLESLSSSEIKLMSVKRFTEIVITVSSDDLKIFSLFKFWTKSYLHHHNIIEFTYEDVRSLFIYFSRAAAKIIEPTEIGISDEVVIILSEYLKNWLLMFNRYREQTELPVSHSSILLLVIEYAFKTLKQFYLFLQNVKSGRTTDGKMFIQKENSKLQEIILNDCQHFQKSLIGFIMEESKAFFLAPDSNDVVTIIPVLYELVEIGSIIPLIDVKITAEMWKFILKLFSDNADYLKTYLDRTQDGKWLENPVIFLCKEIQKSILFIYENIETKSSMQIERILKINLFYLKILTKFALDFGSDYFKGGKDLIETYLFIIRKSNETEGDMNNLNWAQFRNEFLKCLSYIHGNNELQKALISIEISSKESFIDFYKLIVDVFQIYITESGDHNNGISSTEITNILSLIEKLFRGVTTYSTIILKRKNYEDCITTLVALMISLNSEDTCNLKSFETLYASAVKSYNFILCNIGLDIWLTISRFVNVDVRYKYLVFWSKYYEMLPQNSSAPSVSCIEAIIRSLYNFLPHREKQNFWNSCGSFLDNNINVKIISALGFNNIDETKKEFLTIQLKKRLDTFFTDDTTMLNTLQFFNDTINFIKFIQPGRLDSSLEDINYKLEKIAISLIEKDRNYKYYPLLISILKYFENNSLQFKNENFLNNLMNKKIFFKNESTKMKICFIKLYFIIMQNSKPGKYKTIHDFFETMKKENQKEFLMLSSRQDFKNIPKYESYNENELENYLSNNYNFNYLHKCLILHHPSLEEGNPKRIKLDEENEIVKTIFENIKTLSDASKKRAITIGAKDKQMLKSSINILQDIIKN